MLLHPLFIGKPSRTGRSRPLAGNRLGRHCDDRHGANSRSVHMKSRDKRFLFLILHTEILLPGRRAEDKRGAVRALRRMTGNARKVLDELMGIFRNGMCCDDLCEIVSGDHHGVECIETMMMMVMVTKMMCALCAACKGVLLRVCF
jgi:hypothetical protein